MGYTHGGQSYWQHSSDFRNSSSLFSSSGALPACSTPAEVDGHYSTTLYSAEVEAIAARRPAGTPLFVYMAFQSVHNPYDDPYPVVDVSPGKQTPPPVKVACSGYTKTTIFCWGGRLRFGVNGTNPAMSKDMLLGQIRTLAGANHN